MRRGENWGPAGLSVPDADSSHCVSLFNKGTFLDPRPSLRIASASALPKFSQVPGPASCPDALSGAVSFNRLASGHCEVTAATATLPVQGQPQKKAFSRPQETSTRLHGAEWSHLGKISG